MLNIITQLLPVVGEIIDRVIPDPKAREAAKIQLIQQAQEGKFKEVEQQLSAILAEPESIITLFGVGYLGYTGARSYDKFKIKKE